MLRAPRATLGHVNGHSASQCCVASGLQSRAGGSVVSYLSNYFFRRYRVAVVKHDMALFLWLNSKERSPLSLTDLVRSPPMGALSRDYGICILLIHVVLYLTIETSLTIGCGQGSESGERIYKTRNGTEGTGSN